MPTSFKPLQHLASLSLAVLCPFSLIGCPTGTGEDAGTPGDGDGDRDVACAEGSASYCFQSRFGEGSSIDYKGQSARLLLMAELHRFIADLDPTSYVDATPTDVVTDLRYFYDYANIEGGGGGSDSIRLRLSGNGTLLQNTIGEVGLTSLDDKLAGVDNPFPRGVIGWRDGNASPQETINAIFSELATQVIDRAQGANPLMPDGEEITLSHVSAEGVDYQRLVQKYLQGAVGYSQAADDYLRDDVEDKGLLSDNVILVEGKGATNLERAWDEAFGYWGGTRDYDLYTDEEVAGAGGRANFQFGYYDSDGDGAIDWVTEINHGYAVLAAERDSNRCSGANVELSGDIFAAFIAGRTLIAQAGGALNAADMQTLRGHRDAVLNAWERAIAATMVQNINLLLADNALLGSANYDFYAHAQHFSDLKGYAFALQFNPLSMISEVELETLHGALGSAPSLVSADQAATTQALESARALLGRTYNFNDDNLGTGAEGCGW